MHSSPDQSSYKTISEFYNIDYDLLACEQGMFLAFMENNTEDKSQRNVSSVVKLMTDNKLDEIFPNFYKAVHILSCIPAMSCSSERSFSSLRRLKTYLRNSMKQER